MSQFWIFQIDIPVSKQWRPWSDVACNLGLHCLPMSQKWMLGLYGLRLWGNQKFRCYAQKQTSQMSRRMTKPTKWPVRSAKTQISLGICPVWSVSSLCAQWVAKDPSFLHADSEDSGCPGWSESSLGTHAILLVLSWGGSNITLILCHQTFVSSNVPCYHSCFHIRTWAESVRPWPFPKPKCFLTEPCHEKTCSCHMWTTKMQISLDLISAFVVHCLDSIIPTLAKSKISRL